MRNIYFFEDEYCRLEITNEKYSGDNTLAKSRIKRETFEQSLDNILEKYDHVIYVTDMSYCEYTYAYGNMSGNVSLFYEENENIISAIWLNLDLKSEDDYVSAQKLLLEISKLENLILIDHGWEFTAYLSEVDKLNEYLRKRLEVFGKSKNSTYGSQ